MSDFYPGERVHVPGGGFGTVLAGTSGYAWVRPDYPDVPITCDAASVRRVEKVDELWIWSNGETLATLPIGSSPGHRDDGWRHLGRLVLMSDGSATIKGWGDT